jgi:hypothetical protein
MRDDRAKFSWPFLLPYRQSPDKVDTRPNQVKLKGLGKLARNRPNWKHDMKCSRYVLLVGTVLGIVAASVWAWHEIAIDRCLDNGGHWNYQESKCEIKQQ